MKNEQELLSLFYDQKDPREQYAKPWKQDGYVLATDGYIMFRFKQEHSDDVEAYGSGRRFFAKASDCNLLLRRSDIIETLQQIEGDDPITDEHFVQCEECEGVGYVEWCYEVKDGSKTYDMLDTCPVCGGSGCAKNKDISPLVSINAMNIGRKSPMFKCFYISKILKAMDILGVQEARIVNIEYAGMLHVILDDATGSEIFLLSSVSDDYKGVVKEIKTEKI